MQLCRSLFAVLSLASLHPRNNNNNPPPPSKSGPWNGRPRFPPARWGLLCLPWLSALSMPLLLRGPKCQMPVRLPCRFMKMLAAALHQPSFPCSLTCTLTNLRTDPQEVATQGKLLLVGGDAGLLAGVDLRAQSHVSGTCMSFMSVKRVRHFPRKAKRKCAPRIIASVTGMEGRGAGGLRKRHEPQL